MPIREVATTLPHRISTIIKIANNHHMLGDVPRSLDAEVMVGRIAGLIKAESSAILSDSGALLLRFLAELS